jgi:hypothetical protein
MRPVCGGGGLCEESPGLPSFNHNGMQTDPGSCPSDHRPVKFAPWGFLVAQYAPRNDMIATLTCKQTPAPVHPIIALSNSRPARVIPSGFLRGIPGASILQPRRSDLDLSPRPFPKGKGSRSLNGLSPSLQGRAALRRRGVGVGLAHSRIRVPVLWVFVDGILKKPVPLRGQGNTESRRQKTEIQKLNWGPPPESR